MSKVQRNDMWEDVNPEIFSAHAGCRGPAPWTPDERCAAQPRFFPSLVTEARRLDLIFSIHVKIASLSEALLLVRGYWDGLRKNSYPRYFF